MLVGLAPLRSRVELPGRSAGRREDQDFEHWRLVLPAASSLPVLFLAGFAARSARW